MKNFYLTTPLYYVNDKPHIGHAYTTIAADVLARWKRLQGHRVFFLTGTDEHGSKILEAAQAKNVSAQDYADTIVEHFKQAWTTLNISYDDFIRTTQERHKTVVQKVFTELQQKGLIELRQYTGLYCVACESFWLPADVIDGKCPDCKRPVKELQEENFFFKLSAFEERLKKLYADHPEFLSGGGGRYGQEIRNFVNGGLKDISVSRQNLSWGVRVPGAENQAVYVWFDALLNYISALGYGSSDAQKFNTFWPCDVHFVGKEIYRFHTVIWPAMLMALDLPLPRSVHAHGWWTVEGEKMSKSVGNVVDPIALSQDYGVDVVRYFLLREIPFGADGDFSVAALKKRYNTELANDLGNLLSRVLTLVAKNTGGAVSKTLPHAIKFPLDELKKCYDNVDFSGALNVLMSVVQNANGFVEKNAPWKLVKDDPAQCEKVLAECVLTLAWCAAGFYPFMPSIASQIWTQLGQSQPLEQVAQQILEDPQKYFDFSAKTQKTGILFPRLA